MGDSSKTIPLSYPDIINHLYLFDLMDAITILGVSNKDRTVRSLSLVLMQESSKLKRLVAGHDQRKSLADLLYYNDLAIRDRIKDKMILLKMFKFRSQTSTEENDKTFTKTYDQAEIDQILSQLNFYKIMEDSFDYREASINESMARDLSCMYLGELLTLWKNEFKTYIAPTNTFTKDSLLNRVKRQHRIIG